MQGIEGTSTGEANATILMGDFGIGPFKRDHILNTEGLPDFHRIIPGGLGAGGHIPGSH